MIIVNTTELANLALELSATGPGVGAVSNDLPADIQAKFVAFRKLGQELRAFLTQGETTDFAVGEVPDNEEVAEEELSYILNIGATESLASRRKKCVSLYKKNPLGLKHCYVRVAKKYASAVAANKKKAAAAAALKAKRARQLALQQAQQNQYQPSDSGGDGGDDSQSGGGSDQGGGGSSQGGGAPPDGGSAAPDQGGGQAPTEENAPPDQGDPGDTSIPDQTVSGIFRFDPVKGFVYSRS